MRSFRLENGDVSLECLDNDGREGQPLVVIPGLSESIDDWRDFARFLFPRPVYAISLRGRGNSDAPSDAYSLADHISDIRALIDQRTSSRFDLFGYSRGVSYALGVMPVYGRRVRKLILGDYPARHSRLPDDFPASVVSSIWRGKRISDRMPLHAIEALQRSSQHIDLIEAVRDFSGELLLLHGTKDLGALLEPSEIDRYAAAKPDLETKHLKTSGHDLFCPDPLIAWKIVEAFLR